MYIELQTATIQSGSALSAEVALGEKTLCGIYVPSSWTSASITFQVTPDDTNFSELWTDAGSELTLTVSAGAYTALDPKYWRGITGVKVRSGTSGSPVNQSSTVALTLVTRSIY